MEEKKLIFIHLSRRGTTEYASLMATHLKQIISKAYVSDFAVRHIPLPNVTKVWSHQRRWLMGLASLVVLPLLIVNLIWYLTIHNNKSTFLYFPGHHPWNPLIMKIAHWVGVRSIATIHDGNLHQGEESKLMQQVINNINREADGIIYLSEYVRAAYPTNKTHIVMPHPHELLPTTYNKLTYANPLKLLVLGRIQAYKGVDMAIAAVRDMADVQLTIAGEWQQDFPSTPIPPHVEILNKWLSASEMIQLLSSHHICILPYREASQSGILTIAMDARIPVIMTDVGGLKEQIGKYPHVLCSADEDSLRDAIISLYNRQAYDAMKERLGQVSIPTFDYLHTLRSWKL